MSTRGQWYAVRIAKNLGFRQEVDEKTGKRRSRRIVGEFDAAKRFTEDGFEAFVPKLSKAVRSGGGRARNRTWTKCHVPLLSGYVFVRWERVPEWLFDVWPEVEDVVRKPEVIELDPCTKESKPTGRWIPAPIPDDQIAALKALDGTDTPLDRMRRISKGDKVRIVEGPFAGEAVLEVEKEMANRLKVVLLLDLLGGKQPAEIPLDALEKVA